MEGSDTGDIAPIYSSCCTPTPTARRAALPLKIAVLEARIVYS